MQERPDIQGLDDAAERLVATLDEADYLVMTDRTDRKREVRIARLELTIDAIGPHLDHETWQVDTDELPSDITCLDADMLERALTRWMESVVAERGPASRRFRVRAYAVKAMSSLVNCTLVVESQAADHATGLQPVSQPSIDPFAGPTFEEMEVRAAQTGMNALGSYYAQWGAMMLGSMRQVQAVHQDMIDRLHTQVQDGRGQNDELLGALLEVRAAASMVQVQTEQATRKDDTNTLLAQQAIHGIGEAAKAFAMAKTGMPPALVGIAESLGRSSELMDVLQAEDVQDLMKDPENLKMLAMLIQQAAAAKKGTANEGESK